MKCSIDTMGNTAIPALYSQSYSETRVAEGERRNACNARCKASGYEKLRMNKYWTRRVSIEFYRIWRSLDILYLVILAGDRSPHKKSQSFLITLPYSTLPVHHVQSYRQHNSPAHRRRRLQAHHRRRPSPRLLFRLRRRRIRRSRIQNEGNRQMVRRQERLWFPNPRRSLRPRRIRPPLVNSRRWLPNVGGGRAGRIRDDYGTEWEGQGRERYGTGWELRPGRSQEE